MRCALATVLPSCAMARSSSRTSQDTCCAPPIPISKSCARGVELRLRHPRRCGDGNGQCRTLPEAAVDGTCTLEEAGRLMVQSGTTRSRCATCHWLPGLHAHHGTDTGRHHSGGLPITPDQGRAPSVCGLRLSGLLAGFAEMRKPVWRHAKPPGSLWRNARWRRPQAIATPSTLMSVSASSARPCCKRSPARYFMGVTPRLA